MTLSVRPLTPAQKAGHGATSELPPSACLGGGGLLFLGRGRPWLIGPESEHGDLSRRVRQRRVKSFLALVPHEVCLAGIGHRTAAIAGSRRLPRRGQGREITT